jgi:hypothetical protein
MNVPGTYETPSIRAMSGQIVGAKYIEANIFKDNAAKWLRLLGDDHS